MKPTNWRESSEPIFSKVFFTVPRLPDTDKSRRLQFMKTRYKKPKCRGCGKSAHYYVDRKYFCKRHLPSEGWRRLGIEWQWTHIIMPIADNLAKMGRG